MNLYLIIFCLVLYFILNESLLVNENKKFIIIISLVLLLLSGLRSLDVGLDTRTYFNSFYEIRGVSWDQIFSNFYEQYFHPGRLLKKDPGYAAFEKIIYSISSDYRVFLFVVSGITIGSFGRFMYRNSTDLKCSLFAYVYYICLFFHYIPNSALRQSLAWAILLVAYECMQKRNLILYIILIVLASTIHKSVLIAMPVYFVCMYKRPTQIFVSSMIAFVLVLFLHSYIAPFLSENSGMYAEYSTTNYFQNTGAAIPLNVLLLYTFFYLIIIRSFMESPGWVYSSVEGDKDRHGYDVTTTDGMIDKRQKGMSYELVGSAFAISLVPMVLQDPSFMRAVSYFAVWIGILLPKSTNYIDFRLRSLIYIVLYALFIYQSLNSIGEYKFFWEDLPVILK